MINLIQKYGLKIDKNRYFFCRSRDPKLSRINNHNNFNFVKGATYAP